MQRQGPEGEHEADAVVLKLLHGESADQMEALAAAHLGNWAQESVTYTRVAGCMILLPSCTVCQARHWKIRPLHAPPSRVVPASVQRRGLVCSARLTSVPRARSRGASVGKSKSSRANCAAASTAFSVSLVSAPWSAQ